MNPIEEKLNALKEVYVCGVDARKKDTFPALDPVNFVWKQDVPLLPDLLKAEDGRSFYPCFTSMAQVPEQYKQFFLWVAVPFHEFCAFAVKSTICHEIIINPFTSSLILPENIVVKYSGLETPDNGHADKTPEVKA